MSRSAAPGSPLCCRNSANNTRTGGGTEDSSGDIFIAFATGNDTLQAADYAHKGAFSSAVQMVNNDHLSELFLAAAEAVEEAIINALLAATDTQGNGHLAKALEGQTLLATLRQAGWQPAFARAKP